MTHSPRSPSSPLSPSTPGSAKRFVTTTYIPAEGYLNLHSYKYRGEDRSLIYKHILTPMNQALIELFPVWLAPNVITMAGLLCVIVSYICTWVYCPGLEGHAPPWVYILNGVMLLVYQTLDNLDGRQARRVGAGSPLGLFFDHGCDALNCTIGALTMMSTTQMGCTWKSLVFMISTITAFYINTWEEYYTGTLVLPIINGPTEGLIIAAGCHVFTAYAGADWWLSETFLSVPKEWLGTALEIDTFLNQYLPNRLGFAEEVATTGQIAVSYNGIFCLILLTMTILTLIGNVINVWQAVHGPEGHGLYTDTWLVRKFPFFHALTRLVPFVAFCALAILWIAVSPTEIMKKHPRMVFWTIGLLFAKLVTHLMIAHLCAVEYHALRRTLVPVFFFAIHSGVNWWNKSSDFQVNEDLLVYEFFVLALCTYLHLVTGCIREFKMVLGINCFVLKKPLKKTD